MKKALILASVASMIDQFNMHNIQLLLDLDFHVDVACNFVEGNTCSLERVEELKKRLAEMGVRYYQIDFTRSVMNLYQDYIAYKQVLQLMQREKYRFVHCHSPIGGVIGRIAAHRTGTKVIYTAHGFHFYKGGPKKSWVIFYPIEKVLSKWTDVLITINKEDYERAQKSFCAKKTVYVPGVGIDLKKFKAEIIDAEQKRIEWGVNNNQFLFVSIGELTSQQNHEIVIRALHHINIKNIKYFIAGNGELKQYLEELIKKLGMQDRIKLLEANSNVSELCQMADALIIASSGQEEISAALVEAIACKCIVLGACTNGNMKLIKNKEYLFEPNSITEVSEKISLLVEKSDRKSLKKVCNTQIEDNYNALCSLEAEKIVRVIKQESDKYEETRSFRVAYRIRLCEELGIAKNSKLVFSVGELNNNKNHAVVIRAIAILKNTSVHYIIAGVGKEKEKLENLSVTLGVRQQVHFLGFRTDIPELLNTMDIYCLPSLREGLNVSLMEAMAAGLPAVVGRIRGNVDLVENGEGGFLCSPENPKEFAKAISILLNDVDRSERCAKTNLEHIKMFGVNAVDNIIKSIYIAM